MVRIFNLLIIVSMILTGAAHADPKPIYASHIYVLGGNESKSSARQLCSLEVRHKLLAKARPYIEIRLKKTAEMQFWTQKDRSGEQHSRYEQHLYLNALLEFDIVKEVWGRSGRHRTVELTASTPVDVNYIRKQLFVVHLDPALQYDIKLHQEIRQDLENTISDLQKQIITADASRATALIEERNAALNQIDALLAKQIEMLKHIKMILIDACNRIHKGMTKKDVKSILGPPNGINVDPKVYDKYSMGGAVWSYDTISVWFTYSGLVKYVTGCRTESDQKAPF